MGRKKTHGKFGTRVFVAWSNMIQRCNNPKNRSWPRYGKRGIRVCDEWLKFENFYRDMGDPPDGYTLERKNPNLHYTPDNCCWVDKLSQANNKVGTVKYAYQGKTMSLSEWARERGVSYHVLNKRLKILGWSVEQTLGMPVVSPKCQCG